MSVNIGDTESSGLVTLTVTLPAGVTREAVHLDVGALEATETPWVCPGSPGDSVFTCTITEPIQAHIDARNLILDVAVAPGAAPDLVATAEISGGGASEAPAGAGCAPGAVLVPLSPFMSVLNRRGLASSKVRGTPISIMPMGLLRCARQALTRISRLFPSISTRSPDGLNQEREPKTIRPVASGTSKLSSRRASSVHRRP